MNVVATVPTGASDPTSSNTPISCSIEKQVARLLTRYCQYSYVLGSEAWEEYSSGLLSLIKDFVLSVWEERKVRLYGEHSNVHQSHSQNDSGDLRGVAGGDGELGCLCGKAGTSHLCDGSAHSSGCMVNGYGCLLSYNNTVSTGTRAVLHSQWFIRRC